jgi:hypothetical protein
MIKKEASCFWILPNNPEIRKHSGNPKRGIRQIRKRQKTRNAALSPTRRDKKGAVLNI